jgi:hypothetical protein
MKKPGALHNQIVYNYYDNAIFECHEKLCFEMKGFDINAIKRNVCKYEIRLIATNKSIL